MIRGEYSRKVDWRYIRSSLPRTIPKGRVLVHNRVIPVGFHKKRRQWFPRLDAEER
jgi:hypothetical protein